MILKVEEIVNLAKTTVGRVIPIDDVLVVDSVEINTLKKSNSGRSVYLESGIVGVRMHKDGTIVIYCCGEDYDRIKMAIEQGRLWLTSDFIEW